MGNLTWHGHLEGNLCLLLSESTIVEYDLLYLMDWLLMMFPQCFFVFPLKVYYVFSNTILGNIEL